MFYHHVSQFAVNKLETYTPLQGSANWIFQRKYLSQDMGRVFAYLRDVLERAQWPLIDYVDFHLVNLYSTFYQNSHGRCPPPPEDLITPATRLCVTFAQTLNHYGRVNNVVKTRYPEWSFMWGEDAFNRYDYFTVNIPITEFNRFTFKPMLPMNMYYTYNVLSMLTKNYVRHYGDPRKTDLDLYEAHNQCANLSFGDFIKRHPWWMLPYHKYTWKRATNLLTTMMDEQAAMYYALYLADGDVLNRVAGDRREEVLYGDNSIMSWLSESITRFFDIRPVDTLLVDLLFPAFLYDCSGKHYIANASYHYARMSAIRDTLFDGDSYIDKLNVLGLYPYEDLAVSLIARDLGAALSVFGG